MDDQYGHEQAAVDTATLLVAYSREERRCRPVLRSYPRSSHVYPVLTRHVLVMESITLTSSRKTSARLTRRRPTGPGATDVDASSVTTVLEHDSVTIYEASGRYLQCALLLYLRLSPSWLHWGLNRDKQCDGDAPRPHISHFLASLRCRSRLPVRYSTGVT